MEDQNKSEKSTQKEHVFNEDPRLDKQITAAFEKLSDEDKELFEDTQLIHTDRDIPVETQVHHVLKLHKKGQRKRRIIFLFILVLLMAGIVVSILGIYFMRKNRAQEADAVRQQNLAEKSPDVDTSNYIAVNDVNFPDAAFRQRILDQADTNQDQMLSPDEISSVLILNYAGDTRIRNLKGIEYLTSLQSVDVSSTSITDLDVSSNTELTYLNASSTSISSLDLSRQSKLTDLDVSNCASLQQLILPSPSVIKTLKQDGTSMNCETNNEEIYTGCVLNSNQ